jgi:hypothetical protein
VHDHGGVAVVAGEDPAAAVIGAAEVVGETAAVEEEDGLSAVGEGAVEGVLEAWADEAEVRVAAGVDRGAGAAFEGEVDDLDAGRLEGAGGAVGACAADAPGESPEGEAALDGVGVGLERGGGGTEDDGAGGHLGAFDGGVAGVVARELVLLVGGVVLFVDDDEAEAVERSEDGGAWSDDDADG